MYSTDGLKVEFSIRKDKIGRDFSGKVGKVVKYNHKNYFSNLDLLPYFHGEKQWQKGTDIV